MSKASKSFKIECFIITIIQNCGHAIEKAIITAMSKLIHEKCDLFYFLCFNTKAIAHKLSFSTHFCFGMYALFFATIILAGSIYSRNLSREYHMKPRI